MKKRNEGNQNTGKRKQMKQILTVISFRCQFLFRIVFFFCLFSTDIFEGIFALTSNFDLTECTRAGSVISHTTISPGDGVVLLQYVVALVLVGLLVAAAQGLHCFVLGFN